MNWTNIFTGHMARAPRALRRTAFAASLALVSSLGPGLGHNVQAAPSWPQAPYTYFANNESLQAVLQHFASGFSLSLRMGKQMDGIVNGKFNTGNPTEFMDKLGGVYGFNWFVYAGTLYISPANDVRTLTVKAAQGSIAGLQQALQQLGVLDRRFGWGELPDQDLALVSGPPDYVDLVDKTVQALPAGSGRQEVVVFRLKYASVNDRIINYRNQKMTTPGLTTVLRSLISGNGDSTSNDVLASIAAPLRAMPPAFVASGLGNGMSGKGMSGKGMSNEGMGSEASASFQMASPVTSAAYPGGGNRSRAPTVQADPRLNAIIVQDVPERIPVYRALIAQLDVPSTLVEIEAMIVDVNAKMVSELGVSWGARAGKSTFGYGSVPSESRPAFTPGGFLPTGTIGLDISGVLSARIHALADDNQANILSQPSILTADNMGAIIDLSSTFYIKTVGERVASVTPIQVGTSLRVTPRYIDSKDGPQVELTVDIEDGRIGEERPADGLPLIAKSNISTLAVVANGQTLLIGGYNSSQDSNRTDKVPVLGDIPGLGAMFSSKSKSTERRERLFLIRPRVVAVNGVAVGTMPELMRWGDALGATWGDHSFYGKSRNTGGAMELLTDAPTAVDHAFHEKEKG